MRVDDIALKDLVLLWSPANRNMPNAGAFKVVAFKEHYQHDSRYLFSGAALYAEWRDLPDNNARYGQLFAELVTIMARDKVPFENIHRELLRCPEYRAILASDVPCE